MGRVRLGVADHLGWAVVVMASDDHEVIGRQRIELIEPGLPAAPIHHIGGSHAFHQRGKPLDDEGLQALVEDVRLSVVRTTSAALDSLAAPLSEPIVSMSLRVWPDDFPDDIAIQRRVPYESRADPIMYRQVLAERAGDRGWAIHFYDSKSVEAEAERILGERAHDVLDGPRKTLGRPWSKDHRRALAATVVAEKTEAGC